MNRPTVVIELAGDAGFSRDLAAGGVFVPGCTLQLAQECDLVVRGANHQLVLTARVVYVDELRGAGLELIGFSPEMTAQLAELEPVVDAELVFIDEPVIDESQFDGSALDEPTMTEDDPALGGLSEPVPLIDLEALDDAGEDDLAVRMSADDDGAHCDADDYAYLADAARDHGVAVQGADAGSADAFAVPGFGDPDDGPGDLDGGAAGHGSVWASGAEAHGFAGDVDPANPAYAELVNATTLPPEGAPGRDEVEAVDDPCEAGRAPRTVSRSVHERLRGLTLVAQQKLAVGGELHERIVLERLYGKNVWETLLRNPRLTAPEVARIARYGALPRVLLEIIVGNNAWLQIPEVRRALLANPRLAADQIMKVLRLTPKHELKLAAIQTAYPHAVRNAAKMLLRGD